MKKLKVKHLLTFTFLRVILAIITFGLILYENRIGGYFFGVIAGISFLEGFMAKKHKVHSQVRSIADPFADKLIINLTAIALFMKGTLPLWVMLVFLVKDSLFVLAGGIILAKNAKTTFRSNVIDKISVFMQYLALQLMLIGIIDEILLTLAVVFVGIAFIVTLIRSGIRVVDYKTELEEIQFKKLLKLPDFITMLNIFMGLLSIFFTMKGDYSTAMALLLVAVLFDWLDGKAARRIKRKGDFGKQLDSLADTVSFGVAPAIFGFSVIQSNLAMIIFALFLFAGVLRLARYNIMEFEGEFAGMPITVNGVVIPLVYFSGVDALFFPYIYLFLAILMVSPLKFKKLF